MDWLANNVWEDTMAKRAASKAVKERLHEDAEAPIGRLTIRPSKITQFRLWIVGTTPLITHAWAEKAKREMLGTQLKVIKGGRAARDPERDFMDSLYEMTPDLYGFPVTGLKKAIISQAHKDRGVPKTTVQASLWLHHEMIRVRPALAGAICDMPLIRIYGAKPEMREDMVRVGAGLNKRATLAYRAQFWPWAFYLSGRFNADEIGRAHV